MTDPDHASRLREIEAIFHDALDRPAAERTDFLDGACGDDADLRREVERLLRLDDGATDYIATAGPVAEAPPAPDGAGGRVGRYRLVEKIGDGGMGAVWLAERDDRHYRQQVAVKLIRPGLATADLLDRFRVERQVMARLEHANIARLLDGGATEEGRPYLVMEHVDGVPVGDYCDRRRLGVTARLKLFRRICAAVHYAHRNLVVHRDLKPGNILVTADGEPKLLDFGIAKLLADDDDASASVTRTGERLLTPRYASPEQIEGRPVTTASDVYSLGVILYELLAGNTPYQVTTGSYAEYARAVLVQEPVRPSVAVARTITVPANGRPARTISPETVSATRSCDSRRLRRLLSGDLDRIVLMALRKEPERRYASAEQLSEDLDRYLRGLPVVAQPDTWRYRSSRFVRRNRVAVGVAAVGVILLTGALAVIAGLYVDARSARHRAEREAGVANAVIDTMAGAFSAPDPLTMDRQPSQPQEITAVEVLAQALDTLDGDEALPDDVEAIVRGVIGRTYANLGALAEAEAQLRQALEMQERALGEDDPRTVETRRQLGSALRQDNRYQEAEPLLRRVLEQRRATLGPDDPQTLDAMHNVAAVLADLGAFEEAEALFQEVIAGRRRVLGPDAGPTLNSMNSLALLLQKQKKDDEAAPLVRETVERSERALGPSHPRTLVAVKTLARVERNRGVYDEAERLYRRALEGMRTELGEDHYMTLDVQMELGRMLNGIGRPQDAIDLLDRTDASQARVLGENHPTRLLTLTDRAMTRAALEEDELAEALFREAIERATAHLPPQHAFLPVYYFRYGEFLEARERFEEAEPQILEAHQIALDTYGPDHRRTWNMVRKVVALYEAWGQADEAARWTAKLPGG